MRRMTMWLALSATAAVLAGPAAAETAPELFERRLETRDDVLMGELDNGLRYIVKQHQNPPDRLNIILHISSGSINETEPQRGMAHFLEHLAFNGSENFGPGETIKLFEKLGLTFGRDQNAFTSFDQTAYILQVPETTPELVEPGMLFLSDVLGRLLLLPEEVEKEREVVLEEYRRGRGPQARVFDELIERVTPGSRLSKRLPIGTPDHIKNFSAQDARDYWERWYTTGNATLIVAGDMDPESVVPYIQQAFGELPAGPRPADVPAEVEPYTEPFAAVITDPELTETEFALYSIASPNEPATTVGHLREELVDQVAGFVFNRRLRERVAAGDVAFRSGTAGTQDLFEAMKLSSAGATGELSDWESMLEDLTAEVKRAREFGFTEREVEAARKAILAQSEQFARIESTLPGRVMTQVMLQAVNGGEPLVSAARQASYMEELLPTITAEEVSARFSALHTPERAAFVLTAPESGETPDDDSLLDAALSALEREVTARAEEDRPTELMSELPRAGTIAQMQIHPETGVFSAWMDNGARVHHRYMDYRKDSATVTISVAGGRILEDEATRGLSAAASVALRTPATSSLSSTDITEIMTGENVSVFGNAGLDRVTIVVSGSPEDLESGMRLAHLLLSDAEIEGPAFEQWKQDQAQAIAARKTQPQGYFGEVLSRAWMPEGDPRHAPLEQEDLDRLTLGDAQAWLDKTMREGPIEVSVGGDIERARAAELVAMYIGSLAPRERITPSTFAGRRDMSRVSGPVTVDETIESLAPTAFVFGGFYGVNESDVEGVDKMQIAAQILRSRMIQILREERGLVYSIGAVNDPASAYPGFGRFFAASPAEVEKADDLSSAIHEIFADFASEGPSEEELATAKLQIANVLEETRKEPSYWTGELQDLTYRGRSLSDVASRPERMQTYTASQVRDEFRSHYRPENKFTVVIRPEAPAGGE